MSSLCVLNNIPFDDSLLPSVGYKKDTFTQRIEFNSKGVWEEPKPAGEGDKGKASIEIPYIPTNTAYSAMVGNFKGKFLSLRFPTAKQSQIDAYFAHIDWMIALGIKELIAVKKTLMSDDFIDFLIEHEPDPKKPGETKYLVFLDGKILTDNPLIKKHWAERRLSLLNSTSGICSLTGKQSDSLIDLFPTGLERPQRMKSDCKIASFDKSYTWLQDATKKDDAICPVDFFESDRLLARGQWFFDFTGPDEPARRIQLDADTHMILFSAGDNLALFNPGDLVSSYTDPKESDDDLDDDLDDDSDDDDDGDLIDLDQIEKDYDYQKTLAYWRSPVDGKEVTPGDSLVYGLTCKFKQGRFCITDAWQGIPEQVEVNYQKFINSQKATGDCFFYGQKRDVLPIKSLAQVIEPHGVKSQVARIMEKMFRAALYGDKLPLSWLSKIISRYALDGRLDTKKRESPQEWKLKLINVILENNNMNDTESVAYKLGQGLAYYAIGEMKSYDKKEFETMVRQKFSIIRQNPSAAISDIDDRFCKIYAPRLDKNGKNFSSFFLKKVKFYHQCIPATLSLVEQGQLLSGYNTEFTYYYSKKEKETDSANTPDTDASESIETSEQLTLTLGE